MPRRKSKRRRQNKNLTPVA